MLRASAPLKINAPVLGAWFLKSGYVIFAAGLSYGFCFALILFGGLLHSYGGGDQNPSLNFVALFAVVMFCIGVLFGALSALNLAQTKNHLVPASLRFSIFIAASVLILMAVFFAWLGQQPIWTGPVLGLFALTPLLDAGKMSWKRLSISLAPHLLNAASMLGLTVYFLFLRS